MRLRSKRIATAIAIALVFSTSQIYIGLTFAELRPETAVNALTVPQQAMGILATTNNNPVTVNGSPAVTGATVLSGASVATPGGVSAVINLGALGSLEIEENSRLTLIFGPNTVKVMVTAGCVLLRTTQGTRGEISTPQGVASTSDPAKSDVLRTCDRVRTAPASAAGGGGGLSGGATAAIVLVGGAAIIGIVLATRGDNPSPNSP